MLKDKDGLPIGTASENPILDTRMHEVEYADGYKTAMAANAIAKNLFAQVDQDGQCFGLFEEIIDHRTDGTEIKEEDAFIHMQMVTNEGMRPQKYGKCVYNGRTVFRHGTKSRT